MIAKKISIFVSYAGLDDEVPAGTSIDKGFVTFFREQLKFALCQKGPPRVEVWYDKARIERGEQFNPKIAEGLQDADLLVVVLSRNWLDSKNCQNELEIFADRWKAESLSDRRNRIVVVGRQHIDLDKRPDLLRDQVGYLFYKRNKDDKILEEQPFYDFGKVQSDDYYTTLALLSEYIWRRAKEFQLNIGEIKEPEEPAAPEAGPAKLVEVAPATVSPPNGRSVFLSKPADDMRPAYERLVKELQGKGFSVEPDPDAEMPRNSGALAFIEEALAKSEAAVHLLGEKPGFAPDDANLDRIVKLQLTCAAKRAEAADPNAALPFHRIIWAPKILDDGVGNADDRGRDPFAVLARFDRQLPSDKIVGSVLTHFAEFLLQRLAIAAPQRPAGWHSNPEAVKRIYLYHTESDSEFAFKLADALHPSAVELIFPAFDGDDNGKLRIHRQNLDDCDVVAVCWASANEVWAKGAAQELSEWERLRRKQPFSRRAVVAGPPPNNRKSKRALSYIFPPTQIDVVVDLVNGTEPTIDVLRELDPDAASVARAAQ